MVVVLVEFIQAYTTFSDFDWNFRAWQCCLLQTKNCVSGYVIVNLLVAVLDWVTHVTFLIFEYLIHSTCSDIDLSPYLIP